MEEHSLLEPVGINFIDTSASKIGFGVNWEYNLLKFPIFAARAQKNAKDIIEIKDVVEIGGDIIDTDGNKSFVPIERRERVWRVVPNVKYGLGGPFDDKVFMAVQKIITNMPKPIENPINIGSLREISKIIGIKHPSSKDFKDIRNALRRIATTSIEAEETFFDKESSKYLKGREGVFHLFDSVWFKDEERTMPDGEPINCNCIYLSEPILRSFNSGYVCPLNIEFYLAVKNDTARALFKILVPRFLNLRQNNYDFLSLRYSKLSSMLGMKVYDVSSKAKEQFSTALNELVRVGFLENFKFEEILEEKDWLVLLYHGDIEKVFPDNNISGNVAISSPFDIELSDEALVRVVSPSEMLKGEKEFSKKTVKIKKNIPKEDNSESWTDTHKVYEYYTELYCHRYDIFDKSILQQDWGKKKLIGRYKKELGRILEQYGFDDTILMLELFFHDNRDYNLKNGHIPQAFCQVSNSLYSLLTKISNKVGSFGAKKYIDGVIYFLLFYRKEFYIRFKDKGMKPVMDFSMGMDAFGPLLRKHENTYIENLIVNYFDTADSFIVSNNYSLKHFSRRIPFLLGLVPQNRATGTRVIPQDFKKEHFFYLVDPKMNPEAQLVNKREIPLGTIVWDEKGRETLV